jgi:hypothetical protein
MALTLAQRADAYADTFPKYPASHLRLVQENGGDCLYGTWVLGNNYRAKEGYYGEYPPDYLTRVMALFPDVGNAVLHAFSGSVPKGPYDRCDLTQPCEFPGDILTLCQDVWRWYLVLADPPYTPADAERYRTPMVNRAKVIRALARVVYAGGHLAWLDTVWPMHRKSEWRTAARITIVRSTNHRVRLLTIFERQ